MDANTTADVADANSSTFNVLFYRRDDVEAGLVKLSKRAARKGLTPPTWTWGKAATRVEVVPHPQYGWDVEHHAKVTRIPVTIVGDAPHYAGWSFAATLQHLTTESDEAVNIVRSVEGKAVPEKYRERGPFCDHCHSRRRRNDTYVLAHDDGRHVQVGSTCLTDFLGSPDAAKLAAAASIIAEARETACKGEEGYGLGENQRTLSDYLAFVASCIRKGGWISRSSAQDGRTPTAQIAWFYALDRKEASKDDMLPTDEDRELARVTEEWTEALTDEQVNECSSDYLHNLRAVAMTGVVTSRLTGIAGSMVVAYWNAMGLDRLGKAKPAAADVHVGTVGKREAWEVILDFVHGFETAYGYTTILKFKTAKGATLVWKASSCGITKCDVGKRYSIKGTVKEHGEYRSAKQTVLTRCKLVDLEEKVAEEATA